MFMKRSNVPKPNAFTAKGGYSGNVNGINISKNVMLDNSNPNTDVIHIMLQKFDLLTLADKINQTGQSSGGLMSFTDTAWRRASDGLHGFNGWF